MKIDRIERTVISADDGKILTDGEHYGKIFALAEDRKVEEFTEISELEYAEIVKENTETEEGGVTDG
jgi:hypothetical protein